MEVHVLHKYVCSDSLILFSSSCLIQTATSAHSKAHAVNVRRSLAVDGAILVVSKAIAVVRMPKCNAISTYLVYLNAMWKIAICSRHVLFATSKLVVRGAKRLNSVKVRVSLAMLISGTRTAQQTVGKQNMTNAVRISLSFLFDN